MVYLDNASTTKVADEVVEAMRPYLTDNYGNASSNHKAGRDAKDALEEARELIANSIGADPQEIIFTSGGTESNNLAIRGVIYANKGEMVVSQIEHESILEVCKQLDTKGFKTTYLSVDSEGMINLEKLKQSITKDTTIVSIMHGNNEIGTIQDLEEISKICKEENVLLHTDACQSFTKVKLDSSYCDLISLNSHKIHGPKGVGALYIKSGTKIKPMLFGGGHEFGLRSGTENVAGIVGFAKAVEISTVGDMGALKERLIDGILKIPDTKSNGDGLPHIANFSFKGVQGESVVAYLDEYGICVSVGSACTTDRLKASHVLKAIGLNDVNALSSVRFSLSKYTTEDEIDKVLGILPRIIEKLRKVSPLS